MPCCQEEAALRASYPTSAASPVTLEAEHSAHQSYAGVPFGFGLSTALVGVDVPTAPATATSLVARLVHRTMVRTCAKAAKQMSPHQAVQSPTYPHETTPPLMSRTALHWLI